MIWLIPLGVLAIAGFGLMLWSWPKSLPEADRSRRYHADPGTKGYT